MIGVIAWAHSVDAGASEPMQMFGSAEFRASFLHSTYNPNAADGRAHQSSSGVGIGVVTHGSIVGIARDSENGFYVQDWWTLAMSYGGYGGRNGRGDWYTASADTGVRIGVHDEDRDVLVHLFARTGVNSPLVQAGDRHASHEVNGAGVGLALRFDPITIQVAANPWALGQKGTRLTTAFVGFTPEDHLGTHGLAVDLEMGRYRRQWESAAPIDEVHRTALISYAYRVP